MIKKISVLLFSVFLFFSLCSCKGNTTSASGQNYLISSLGFDNIDNKIVVYLEAVIVNSEDTSAQKNIKLIKGTGETCQKAFAQAEEQTVQDITLSHCATVAIGKSVTPKQLEDIYSFLYDTDELSLSIVLVSCHSSKDLLSLTPTSSIAMGYDILDYLGKLEKTTGTVYLNKLYNIFSLTEKPYLQIGLPFIMVNNSDYSLDGMTLNFKNTSIFLNKAQSLILSIISGQQRDGKIILGKDVLSLNKVDCEYDFSNLKNNIITLNITTNSNKLNELLPEKVNSLFEVSKKNNLDIFSFYNNLYYTDKKLWGKYSQLIFQEELKILVNALNNKE